MQGLHAASLGYYLGPTLRFELGGRQMGRPAISLDRIHMSAHGPGYNGLLRELLLSLSGFSGDVFVENATSLDISQGFSVTTTSSRFKSCGAQDVGLIQLASDISWIDGPDRVILDELCRLGFYYREIRAFVDREMVLAVSPEQPRSGSMYCRALTEGLQELMEVYQSKLQQIQEAISSQVTTLPGLQFLLADFQVLLPEAYKLLSEVHLLRRKDFKGSELIALLHSRVRCGVPVVQSVMQRLLWHCNQVLVHQLTSWMVHGLLLDPFHESFIVQALPPAGQAPSSAQLPKSQEASGSVVMHDDWQAGCKVDVSALPLYISLETANTILFVGKAVRLLKHPTGVFSDMELLSNSDVLEFVEAMRTLQMKHTFQQAEFEHTVEGIRSKVAAVLWQLLVVQADLMGHLSAFKDYFLLAKGDFYHSFLVESQSLMSLPPRPSFADADIHIPFQHSALKSTAQHDRLFSLFRLRWKSHEVKGEVQALDNWDSLFLEYQVEWPMGLLLTPPIIARYNVLFQLLMRLKRVQLKLEGAWQSLHALYTHRRLDSASPEQPGAVSDASAPKLRQLYRLRHHMAHLIANLQIYIQVDVIESNYKVLEERIRSAQDFAEAERAHANYLHALVNQCFLNTVTITRAIGAVFKQAQELCRMVDAFMLASGLEGPRRSAPPGADPLSGLPALQAHFSQSVNQLYTYLQSSRLQDANKAPHLRQLYLRLNFNNYVDSRVTQGVVLD